MDFLLAVGEAEELLVHLVQLVLVQFHAVHFQAVLERRPAAAGRQDDGIRVDAHVLRVDDLVGLGILQDAVLVDAGRVGEGVLAHDGLVRLHRHVHQGRHEPARGIDALGVDVRLQRNPVMGLQDHGDLLQGGVPRPFADAVDRDLALAGAVQQAGHRIGRRHSEIVVAMRRKNGLVDPVHMLHQVLDLGSEFLWETVARRVGDVHDGRARLDHGFHHTGEELIVGAAGVLRVEFHVLDVLLRVLDGPDGPLQHLFPGGIELVPDVRVGRTDSGVDPAPLGVLERLRGHVDVLFHGPRQRADRGPGHRLGDLHHRVEITRAGDRETGLDDVHTEELQGLGDLDLLHGVQLTSRDLFPVAERGVEYVHPVAHRSISSGRSLRTAAPVRQSSLSRSAFSSFSRPSR